MSASDDRTDEEVTPPLDSSDEQADAILNEQDDIDEIVSNAEDVAEPTELAAAEEVDLTDFPDAADEAVGEATQPETLPLLDANGNTPTKFDDVLQSLRLWEEAAAEAGDDPLFTPQPTTKSRRELMLLDRGPGKPLVWLDHENKRPVLYAGDVDSWIFGDPLPAPLDDPSSSDEADEQPADFGSSMYDAIRRDSPVRPHEPTVASLSPTCDEGPLLVRPIVTVRLAGEQRQQVHEQALSAVASRDPKMCKIIAETAVWKVFQQRDAEERAIMGD